MDNLKKEISQLLNNKTLQERIDFINELREFIHLQSPFKNEPVDFVKWVKSEMVTANDYNPNKVAPPEMELLEVSIMNDGYTQPVVTFQNDDKIEVVDGFHRTRVAKESKIVRERVLGFAPTVIIRKEQSGKSDRIASTIRHNRARGKHLVNSMSEIVLELKNRNWTNERISKELGMDQEEILRLCQISGLQEMFKDSDFSKSWDADIDSLDFEPITDNEIVEVRTVNTSDPNRFFHTFDKWECYKHGFYDTKKEGMSQEECEQEYFKFLTNLPEFEIALEHIITNWKYSCEHYLTNNSMNRIAWLGQASAAYSKGIPSKYCSGRQLLSEVQKKEANELALKHLNKWLSSYGFELVDMEEALSLGRQVNIY